MKLNNKGFGIIEGILILVTVALLGFVGFRAYQNYNADEPDNSQQVNKRTKNDDKNNNSEVAVTKKNENFMVFEEWGVKIPQVEGVKATGQIEGGEEFGGKAPAGYSTQLISASALEKYEGCQAKANPMGILSRQSLEDNSQGSAPQFIAKIDGYFYYYSHPQSICYMGSNKTLINESNSIQTELLDKFEASLKKITSL